MMSTPIHPDQRREVKCWLRSSTSGRQYYCPRKVIGLPYAKKISSMPRWVPRLLACRSFFHVAARRMECVILTQMLSPVHYQNVNIPISLHSHMLFQTRPPTIYIAVNTSGTGRYIAQASCAPMQEHCPQKGSRRIFNNVSNGKNSQRVAYMILLSHPEAKRWNIISQS